MTSKSSTITGSLTFCIERFSIDGRKTKTKVITTANKNKGKHHKEPMRIQIHVPGLKRGKREGPSRDWF